MYDLLGSPFEMSCRNKLPWGGTPARRLDLVGFIASPARLGYCDSSRTNSLVSASVLSFGESRKTEKKKSHFILWFAPPRHQITYGTPYIWDSPHLYCSGYNIIRPWSVASSSEFQLPPTYRDAVVELTRHEHLEWVCGHHSPSQTERILLFRCSSSILTTDPTYFI